MIMSRWILSSFLFVGSFFLSYLPLEAGAQTQAKALNSEFWGSAGEEFQPVPARAVKESRRKLIQSLWSNSLFGFHQFPGTNSFKLQWLETESPQRSSWLSYVKNEISPMKTLPQAQGLQAELIAANEYPQVKGSLEVGDLRFEIIKKDWNQNDIVLRKNKKDASEKMIANEALFFSEAVSYGRLSASPDQSKLLFIAALSGSIDNTYVVVYDLATQSIRPPFEINGSSITWKDSNTLIAASPYSNSMGWATEVFYLDGRPSVVFPRTNYFKWGPWQAFVQDGASQVELENSKDSSKKFNFALEHGELTLEEDNFIEADDQYLYFRGNERSPQQGLIYRLKLESGSSPELIISEEHGRLSRVWIEDQDFFLLYSNRGMNSLVIFDGETFSRRLSLDLPNCCELGSAEWTQASEKKLMKLSFRNIVRENKEIEVNVESPLSADQIQQVLVKNSEVELDVELKYIESFDGYQIPITMIKKKGLPIDGQRPVYMETYGGFYSSGYLQVPLTRVKLEFVKAGGIYVGTGVRGGDEAGIEGYLAAIGTNKLTTIKDLVAVANSLVTLGYTQNEKIVSYGASNGGFVVASAGRLFPKSFGIVIPMNGVQDQLSFSLMDRWGLSWASDYGDVAEALDFRAILARSPLEVPRNPLGSCQFLIVSGENDTRVNKIHSYKLKAIMDEYYPGRALLVSADQSGHGAMNTSSQKGIETTAMVWGYIFNYFGMNLP